MENSFNKSSRINDFSTDDKNEEKNYEEDSSR